MENIVFQYLKILKIPVSQEYLKNLLLCHTKYPYLISVADTLEKLGISYEFMRVDKNNLIEGLFPFLMHIDNNDTGLVIISCPNDLKKHNGVIHLWSGLILKIEPKKDIIDVSNRRYIIKEKKSIIMSALLTCIIGFMAVFTAFHYSSGYVFSILITNLSGMFLGYILIKKELGIPSKVVDKLCSLKRNNNCTKALTAIRGKISLSELTFIYFVLQFSYIVLILPVEIDKAILILSFFSLLTFPIVIFSLVYQAFIVKAWCKLCLLVDFVLVMQGIILYALPKLFNGIFNFEYYESTIFPLKILAILLIVSLVIFSVNYQRSICGLKSEESRIKRVFWNPDVFKYYLLKNPPLNMESHEDDFKIGDSNARIKLKLIIDLYCPSCWVAFQLVTETILLFPEKVSLLVCLSPTNKNESDIHQVYPTEYIVSYFMERIKNHHVNVSVSIDLLNDWYRLNNFEKFKQKYPLTDDTYYHRAREQSKRNCKWLESNKIDQVPLLYINGYKMPNEYKLYELKNFINDLAETPEINK